MLILLAIAGSLLSKSKSIELIAAEYTVRKIIEKNPEKYLIRTTLDDIDKWKDVSTMFGMILILIAAIIWISATVVCTVEDICRRCDGYEYDFDDKKISEKT